AFPLPSRIRREAAGTGQDRAGRRAGSDAGSRQREAEAVERDIAEASVPTGGSPEPQGPHGRVAPGRCHAPILTVPDELADVEPVALTGNFWVSLPDLDPATGAARSVGIVSETARGMIEFTGAPEPESTTDRAT